MNIFHGAYLMTDKFPNKDLEKEEYVSKMGKRTFAVHTITGDMIINFPYNLKLFFIFKVPNFMYAYVIL